jgi:hypothetical protein
MSSFAQTDRVKLLYFKGSFTVAFFTILSQQLPRNKFGGKTNLAGKQIWRENKFGAKKQIWRENKFGGKTNLALKQIWREKAILALKQNKFGGNFFSRKTNLAGK